MVEISVIIPTHNRGHKLRECLGSLMRQDWPEEGYEIIVVDDGSTDMTRQAVESLSGGVHNIRYLYKTRQGPASARNLGIKEARAQIIAFTDDDCMLEKDWVRLMVESHKKRPAIAAVGGLSLTPDSGAARLIGQFLSNGAIYTRSNGKDEVIFFPTCNVSFKRGIFDRYSFNEDFPLPGGEDLEFFWSLYKNGERFIWDKQIRLMHCRDDRLASFMKQAYSYGRGNFLVQKVHNDHPLLKEIRSGRFSFWLATLANTIKIPRFSYSLGRRLIDEYKIRNLGKRISVYTYFTLHKIFYLAGNIREFFRVRRLPLGSVPKTHIPKLLIMDITHSCNLSCRVCDIWKTGSREPDIEASYVKGMLVEAKTLGIEEIALSGGEPLLRKDIFQLLAYAKEIGIRNLGILTNGILVAECFQELRPYLIDRTISLVFSLDSLRPDIHNEVRNSDIAWHKTNEALEKTRLLKSRHPQVNFNVITIALNQNLEELYDIGLFVQSLGANSIQYQPLLPNNLKMHERKRSRYWISDSNLPLLDGVVDRLIGLKEDNPAFVKNSAMNLSLFKKYFRGALTSEQIECTSAHSTVLVSNQGTLTTCFSCYGDVKTNNLKEALDGDERMRAWEKARRCSWPCLLPCFCDQ